MIVACNLFTIVPSGNGADIVNTSIATALLPRLPALSMLIRNTTQSLNRFAIAIHAECLWLVMSVTQFSLHDQAAYQMFGSTCTVAPKFQNHIFHYEQDSLQMDA